ncbi:MAG: hypothetical protein ABIH23_08555 [bacterium]
MRDNQIVTTELCNRLISSLTAKADQAKDNCAKGLRLSIEDTNLLRAQYQAYTALIHEVKLVIEELQQDEE